MSCSQFYILKGGWIVSDYTQDVQQNFCVSRHFFRSLFKLKKKSDALDRGKRPWELLETVEELMIVSSCSRGGWKPGLFFTLQT